MLTRGADDLDKGRVGRESSPFLVRPGAVPGLLSWGLKLLRQYNRRDWPRNARNIPRLCEYNHECLHEVVREPGVDYEPNPRGTLRLVRDSFSMDANR